MKIGEYTIDPVLDGVMRIPATAAFPTTSESDWAPHRDLLDENGRIGLSLGGFLLRGGGRTVLVDAGLGHFDMNGRQLGGQMLDNLAALGVKPADVTDVIFSHLHLDHVGWASDEGKPVFTNATYRCDQREWDYWITGPKEAMRGVSEDFFKKQQDAMKPAADRMEMWSTDTTILPGINVQHAPGHTPGSAILVLSGGTQRAVLMGDVVHCPVELLDEEWGGLGDVDPELAKATRNAAARELEGSDTLVSAAHFPGLSFGRLLQGEGKRRWVV
jgi:glyoxylase-like metal-dependent hydrolase (beta-lactamase superfamily II)